MFLKCVAMVIIGTITACIGPFYYCNKLRKQCGRKSTFVDKSETIESQSPLVHIRIMHPSQNGFTNEIVSDSTDTRNSVESNEIQESRQLKQDSEPISSDETQIVPLKTYRNRRRFYQLRGTKCFRTSTKIWSPALSGQLDRIRNSSSEGYGTMRVVRAQIEGDPPAFSSSSKILDKSRRGHRNSSQSSASSQSRSSDDKVRKLSSSAIKKWKNLKRTLICTRVEKSTVYKEKTEVKDPNRLSVPDPVLKQRSPSVRSTTLQKNQTIDVSTSTRLSANVEDARSHADEIISRHGSSNQNVQSTRESRETRNESRDSSMETLQEIVTLIKRQPINGASLCDVKITGLTVNQADLLSLFEATKSDTQTSSLVTTEEASIISIKFHRRPDTADRPRAKDTNDTTAAFYECPLRRFYKRLPEIFEDLSFSGLFGSQEFQKKSHRAAPTVRISDHSGTPNSSANNDTSYIGLPKVRKGLLADESMFIRDRILSGRFDDASRLSKDNRI